MKPSWAPALAFTPILTVALSRLRIAALPAMDLLARWAFRRPIFWLTMRRMRRLLERCEQCDDQRSNISNATTGVLIEDANADWSGDVDLIDDAIGAVSVTIDSDTNIFNTGTGVRVTGSAANALITGNDNSIHDNTVGVDVDGGTATITGNHFYANTTGIQFQNGGTASIVGNNFSSSVAGVDVNGGTALMQGNTFASSIGVRIQNGGIADLGQNGPGINYTGLGVSTGGNTFSSYSAKPRPPPAAQLSI